MILQEIKAYIREHGQVSLEDIINHFDLTLEGAEAMTERLVAQGFVQHIPQTSHCSTGQCSGCTQAHPSDRYQWIPKKLKPLKL